jgi:hypothetical protein
MKRIKVGDLKKLIKDLPDDANFEIDVSNHKIGKRSMSYDIKYKNEIEMGTWISKNKKPISWINIIVQGLGE